MARTILSPSGLRVRDVGDDGSSVNTDMDYNMTLLNDTLLKISAMQDVSTSGLSNNQILRYNSGTSKFEPKTPSLPAHTTTTTV